jgi:hypothetical protein
MIWWNAEVSLNEKICKILQIDEMNLSIPGEGVKRGEKMIGHQIQCR